jgi:hypothetical protein
VSIVHIPHPSTTKRNCVSSQRATLRLIPASDIGMYIFSPRDMHSIHYTKVRKDVCRDTRPPNDAPGYNVRSAPAIPLCYGKLILLLSAGEVTVATCAPGAFCACTLHQPHASLSYNQNRFTQRSRQSYSADFGVVATLNQLHVDLALVPSGIAIVSSFASLPAMSYSRTVSVPSAVGA